jgi:hypothetical protein
MRLSEATGRHGFFPQLFAWLVSSRQRRSPESQPDGSGKHAVHSEPLKFVGYLDFTWDGELIKGVFHTASLRPVFDENCRVHCAFQRTSVLGAEDVTHPTFGFSGEYRVLACPGQAIRADKQPVPSPVRPAPRPRLRQEPEPRGLCETLGVVFQTGAAR